MKQDDKITSEGEPSNESDVGEELQPSLDVDDGLNTSLTGKYCFWLLPQGKHTILEFI